MLLPMHAHAAPATRARRLPPMALVVALALPAATLLAGIATLALIGRDGLDAVADPVRRTAQVQVSADPSGDEADRRARDLALEARLWTTGDGRLWVTLAGPRADDAIPGGRAALALRLEHPLDADGDRALRLQRDGDRWQGGPFDPAIGWRVSLQPDGGEWRLLGRWSTDERDVVLLPAFATAVGTADGRG